MKRGLTSIDAFLAIMIMLFLAFWLENFFNLNFDNAQDYGAQVGIKAETIKIGSILNTFFATNPSPGDFMILNDSMVIFGNSFNISIDKDLNDLNVTANTSYANIPYNSSYPVIARVKYDKTSQKVTA